MAVDTLGQLLAVVVTPANEQERAPVAALTEPVHSVTGESVDVAFVDLGDTGEPPAADAHTHGIRLEIDQRSETNCGSMQPPRRWVVERGFAWMARVRRLARDDENGCRRPWRDCMCWPL